MMRGTKNKEFKIFGIHAKEKNTEHGKEYLEIRTEIKGPEKEK